MALKGNLREFSITQLMNLIHIAAKTGALYAEGSGDTVAIYFRDGKISFAQSSNQSFDLLKVLASYRRIKRAQLVILQEKFREMQPAELGLYLVNGGYLEQEEILDTLQQHYVSVVKQLFAWEEGSFHFEGGENAPAGNILVRESMEDLIVEGAHRLKEYDHLKDEIPSLDMALKFSDRPGTNIRSINLTSEEWKVVSYVNPKNTIAQIAHTAHLNEMEIRRVVYALVQAGIVEIIRPTTGPLNSPIRTFTTQNKEEQKSVVNRLIDRIRSL
ncbi:MAG: DUF4388 domain-containing protein [Anaerolineaceae bacterium]